MVDMVDFDVGEGRDWEGKRGEGREKREGRIERMGKEEERQGLCANGSFSATRILFHCSYHPARAEGTGS